MRSHLVRVILAAFLASCGAGGGSNPDAPQVGEDAASAQDVATALPYCTDKPALAGVTDLSGTWVARVQGAQIVNAPIVGKLNTESIFFVLMTISQTGTAVVLDGRYCDRVENDQSKPFVPVVVIPDAWAHTEKLVHRAGTFAPGAGGYSILSLKGAPEIAGAVLASPSDPLPTAADYLNNPNDPRVIDEDNDGHPGITIQLSGASISGQLYSVQRQITSVEAIAVAADRLTGTLVFNSTQNVLDSDPTSLAALYAQPGTSSVSDPTCNSNFAMVRVGEAAGVDGGAIDAGDIDAGGVDGAAGQGGAIINCAWVRANETALFP
jgi:hypothetical protein